MAEQDFKLPKLPDQSASWFDSLLRPFTDFYLWCQTVDERLRSLLDSLGGVADDLAALEIKDAQAHTIVKVKNVTARFHFVAQWDGTIDSTYTDCQAGTATVRWQINGTNVGSAANSISTTADTKTHTVNNEFEAGDVITYTITSASSCTEALLQANLTRKAA
jgi:hypothetical protein